jgi:GTP pyrophosphokinase
LPFLGHSAKKTADDTGKPITVDKNFNRRQPVYISEDTIGKLKFLSCCHPIPGDDVLGYIDNSNQIAIHKRACPIAARLKSSFGNRILDAKWDMHKQLFFDATIEIRGIDRKGMLYDVSQIISDKMDINMKRITVSSDQGIFDGTIELHVHDRDEVKIIGDNLKTIDGLQEVQQIM